MFRILERVMIVLVISTTFFIGWLFAIGQAEVLELSLGGGVLFLTLLMLMLVQKKVDSLFNIAASQSNFTQEEVYTALYDNSPVAYLTVTSKGNIMKGNAAAVKLLQTDINTIKEINFFRLILDGEEGQQDTLPGKVLSGMTVTDTEVPLSTLGGETIWVLLSVFAYRGSDRRLVSLVDITQQKKIDAAKSEFVALATHQLRTPVAAIRWNAELLGRSLREIKTEAQDRYLDKIERNVVKMVNLIDDFLSVSKLEMGTYATREEDLNLPEFMNSILDEMAGKITEKQLQVYPSFYPEEVTIRIDQRLLHIIVSNLTSNAVKYLRPNGTLQLAYELQNDVLKVVVADDGIGIPEPELDKLFTKFYRASNAQAHQTEGTGLGLYIVKQSAEKLGGGVTVQSAEDQGARFEVTLPVKVVPVG